jgi:GTP:adenosylcobinamide-phosphate guanylyltransferase
MPHTLVDVVTSPVTAVVLGGGDGDALARAAGVRAKALVPFGGKPLACYVLAALQATPGVGEVLYVGTPPTPAVRELEPGATFFESFQRGVREALRGRPERILVLTADLPWLTPEALSAFLASAPDADLVYPVITEAAAKAQFPNQRRTFVRLKEGRFTGGNMMLLRPAAIAALEPFVGRAYAGRKNPLVLAQLLGVDVIARLLLGRLDLPAIEARAERVLGCTVRAVVTEHASIGADVDKPEHLSAAPMQAV